MPGEMIVQDDEELVQINEEPADSDSNETGEVWRIAIIDDDAEVHRATIFAMQDATILGRRLEFLHAYSRQEAEKLFASYPNIAVVLLDVVMETAHAGLELVAYIRETLKRIDTRIILRTGQPGYAPEEEIVRNFDINDYKSKSELTRKKLMTALTVSIRAYQTIQARA